MQSIQVFDHAACFVATILAHEVAKPMQIVHGGAVLYVRKHAAKVASSVDIDEMLCVQSKLS